MGLQAAFWENTSRNKRVVIYASSNCGLPNKKHDVNIQFYNERIL